jgi:heptosyltransferase-3
LKVLLVKLNHIGDTLIMTPTIRAIRSHWPEARIDVVVRKGCEGILEGNPDIDRVIPVARPEKGKRTVTDTLTEFGKLFKAVALRRYDYAFDLSNSDRAKMILILSAAKRRGINRWHNPLGWKKHLFTDFSDFAWGREHQVLRDFRTVQEIMGFPGNPGPLILKTDPAKREPLFERFGLNSPYILIHPTSRWSYKEWPSERWREVVEELHAAGHRIVVTCGPDPREISVSREIVRGFERATSTEGMTSIGELALLIENAELFAGVDTVAMHMAAALQTPLVALFGPSAEWSWGPWKVEHRLVLGNCPCKLARKFTCDKTKPFPCMTGIGSREVLRQIHELLETKGTGR